MPRQQLSGFDLKSPLLLNGSAGASGQVPTSQGAGAIPIWTTPGAGSSENFRYFDAAEFIPRTTNGCGVDSRETSTNRVNRDLLAFDPGSQQFAQLWTLWPSGWNTFRASFVWITSGTTGSCVWQCRARIYTDGDATDNAFGTAQSVTDAVTGASQQMQTAFTPTITPGGTVGDGKLMCIQIDRDAANGSDNLSVNALPVALVLEKVS